MAPFRAAETEPGLAWRTWVGAVLCLVGWKGICLYGLDWEAYSWGRPGQDYLTLIRWSSVCLAGAGLLGSVALLAAGISILRGGIRWRMLLEWAILLESVALHPASTPGAGTVSPLVLGNPAAGVLAAGLTLWLGGRSRGGRLLGGDRRSGPVAGVALEPLLRVLLVVVGVELAWFGFWAQSFGWAFSSRFDFDQLEVMASLHYSLVVGGGPAGLCLCLGGWFPDRRLWRRAWVTVALLAVLGSVAAMLADLWAPGYLELCHRFALVPVVPVVTLAVLAWLPRPPAEYQGTPVDLEADRRRAASPHLGVQPGRVLLGNLLLLGGAGMACGPLVLCGHWSNWQSAVSSEWLVEQLPEAGAMALLSVGALSCLRGRYLGPSLIRVSWLALSCVQVIRFQHQGDPFTLLRALPYLLPVLATLHPGVLRALCPGYTRAPGAPRRCAPCPGSLWAGGLVLVLATGWMLAALLLLREARYLWAPRDWGPTFAVWGRAVGAFLQLMGWLVLFLQAARLLALPPEERPPLLRRMSRVALVLLLLLAGWLALGCWLGESQPWLAVCHLLPVGLALLATRLATPGRTLTSSRC